MYSPKIKDKYVRRLYLLKQQNKKPMTKMVNEAVEEYLEKNNNERVHKTNNKNTGSST